jgi:hypothetical protein
MVPLGTSPRGPGGMRRDGPVTRSRAGNNGNGSTVPERAGAGITVDGANGITTGATAGAADGNMQASVYGVDDEGCWDDNTWSKRKNEPIGDLMTLDKPGCSTRWAFINVNGLNLKKGESFEDKKN